jgi:hypothetical protein
LITNHRVKLVVLKNDHDDVAKIRYKRTNGWCRNRT